MFEPKYFVDVPGLSYFWKKSKSYVDKLIEINKPTLATQEKDGLLSKEDKTKLDSISDNLIEFDPTKIVTSVAGRRGDVILTKDDVGLNNVANESKSTMFNNPIFTGIPTTPTPNINDNSKQIANTEYVSNLISNKLSALSNSLIYKGTIGDGGTITTLPNNTAKVGWSYKVITKGIYADQICEVGDMIICLENGSENIPAVWNVIQTNVDGVIIGPELSINNHIAIFNGGTGKLIKDSGFTIEKSVPADAKFTDTTYEMANSTILGLVKIGYPEEEEGSMQSANLIINKPIFLNESGQMYTTIDIMTEADINAIFL